MPKFKDAARAEKTRTLTPAEQRRLARFEETCATLAAQGYAKTDLTIGIVAANVVGLVAAIPIFGLGILAFCLANPTLDLAFRPVGFFVFFAVFFALIVVHELIHGATWACFAPRRLKDIELGFMVQYLTPYCTCAAPLRRGAYLAGALMPLVVLGIVPAAVGIACGSFGVLFMGLLMILSAMGDVMIALKLLCHKPAAPDVVYCDHPTQAGLVVFERAATAVAGAAGGEGGEAVAAEVGEGGEGGEGGETDV